MMSTAVEGTPPARAGRWLAVGLAILALVAVVISAAFGEPASVVLPLAYGGAGSFVALRRPSNPMGWLLVVIGWGFVLGLLRFDAPATRLLAGGLGPGLAFAAWANSSGYSLPFAGLIAVTALFPDGHLPVGRWRRPTILAIVAGIGITIAIWVAPEIAPTPAGSPTSIVMANPFALAPDATVWSVVPDMNTLYPAQLAILTATGLGLIARSRQATGVARLQYRWFITAIAFVIASTAAWAISTLALSADALGPAFVLAILSMASVPIAIGIAIVRYRLFEIDRIISRTIGWALVTGVLVAVFVVGVVGLQAALTGFTQGQTLAVAASTLVAFALFQPLRRRVQRAVDRRFDRARYDAERTAIAFAERLRDETDIATVTDDLAVTTTAAVAPAGLAVWLRHGGRGVAERQWDVERRRAMP